MLVAFQQVSAAILKPYVIALTQLGLTIWQTNEGYRAGHRKLLYSQRILRWSPLYINCIVGVGPRELPLDFVKCLLDKLLTLKIEHGL